MNVDHPGATSSRRNPVHKALIERHDAIEDRRRYPNTVGEVADHIEIMLQRRHRTLHGWKRRFRIHGARMPNWVEPPEPVAIALIIVGTSTPAFSPSAIASAVAAMLIATRRLLTSLTRLAAPNSPR